MANPNDQAKLKKRLEALVKLPENQTCADCRKRGPRWASANLGIFICIECSGIHRNLGVHISFVRSVNLDSWTKAQVDFMEEWGNKRANDYFEGNMPASVIRPKEGDPVRVVERFIRDKYEHRRYIASSVPPKSAPAEAAVETAPAPAPRRVSAVATPAAVAPVAARPTVATAPVPLSAPKQDVPDLLNLMDDPIPAAAPAAPVQSATAGFGSTDFGDFTSVTTGVAPAQQQQQHTFSAFDSPVKAAAPAQSAASTDFMDFMAAPAAPAAPATVPGAFPPAAPAVPAKPQASADAILSLYASNQAPRGGPMMGGPMMMGGPQGMYPTHMGHISAQNPHPPMMHHHQQQMGGMPMGQPPVNPFLMQQQMPGRGPAPMQYGGAPPMNPFQQQQQQQHHQQQHMQPMGQPMGGMPGAYPGQQPQQMAPPNPFGGLGLPQHHQQQPGGFQSTMPGQGWR